MRGHVLQVLAAQVLVLDRGCPLLEQVIGGVQDLAGAQIPVAVRRILRGEVSVRGVLPPEARFEPQPFFDEAVSLMPVPPPGGKLFGESFEWLE